MAWKYKDMTKEEALAYHRMMWSDMAEEYGDNPTARERADFKTGWVRDHFDKPFVHSCVLCEFVKKNFGDNTRCCYCPIDWLSGVSWGMRVAKGYLKCLLVISQKDFELLYPSADQREHMETFRCARRL